ncbi:hypothetical protein NK553_14815 [Pseudomonas sp. ZM23]|uniref:Uncharacterized protein n=1 Tax=Pseudomonas triclosanedens TaxID=2961893 RepID=A0ABY6ZVP6_9PSED|nr:hypothetical protein [Pseudomonas triclosanedens]MCP8465221.1 hypothetical protein [Pseudomonas triclosanedens]MCP8470839.1 hypothetical protein [Pseudomonas triclosanedens]MCP8476592.1 hypothetical protein [Pseudomonas triclosanedens]WAI49022.1 hypothetical protein OU419_25280 [Pseudomonas triclosanedens]
MAARNSKQQLCVVTVNYECYLLPQGDALKVIDIMSRAAKVQQDYSDGDFKYIVGESPRAELTVVRPGQLVMPKAAAEPVTQRPRRKSPAQLPHQTFLLEGN